MLSVKARETADTILKSYDPTENQTQSTTRFATNWMILFLM